MIRRPPRSTLDRSSAASDVYKRQLLEDAPATTEAYIKLSYEFLATELYSDVTVDVMEYLGSFSGSVGFNKQLFENDELSFSTGICCLLYTSPSPRDRTRSRMPSSA